MFLFNLNIKNMFKRIFKKHSNKEQLSNSEVNKTSLTDDDINSFIKQEIKNRITTKSDICTDQESYSFMQSNKTDSLFIAAAEVVVSTQKASDSLLQIKLKLGYNKAKRIIDQLEAAGIVGAFEGSGERIVKIPNLKQLNIHLVTIKDKYRYFKQNILPLHEDYINQRVQDYFTRVEKDNEIKAKEKLKQEIIEKEKEKLEKEKRKQLREQVIKEMLEDGIISSEFESELKKREPISQEIQDKVWNRDGGKCVKCGSAEKLEFDHIIPFSKGGSNTYRNLQLLCESCNRIKSNNIG